MAINACTKGKCGERELAKELARLFGCTARRGQQFSGLPESPDVVVDIPGVHVECKRTERLRLYDAVEQARHDAADHEVPLVCHRHNRGDWLAIVPLDDLPALAVLLNAALDDALKGAADGTTTNSS